VEKEWPRLAFPHAERRGGVGSGWGGAVIFGVVCMLRALWLKTESSEHAVVS
jgi:hypothetical protein